MKTSTNQRDPKHLLKLKGNLVNTNCILYVCVLGSFQKWCPALAGLSPYPPSNEGGWKVGLADLLRSLPI